MEAIKAIAKRTKTGKYKIDLPSSITEEEVEVMVQVLQPTLKIKKTTADFAGKMKWKGDALAYQKEIRDEWN
jgi:hypothetical protein